MQIDWLKYMWNNILEYKENKDTGKYEENVSSDKFNGAVETFRR